MGITKGLSKILKSVQEVLNLSFDEDFNIVAFQPLEYSPDPTPTLKRKITSILATKIDKVDSSTTYFGEAALGSATNAAVWRIGKISVSGTVTTIQWADGDDSFDNVWDNRASLNYS